jgi:hypothetical protein
MPAELDHGRQLALLEEYATDRGSLLVGDSEHGVSMGLRRRNGKQNPCRWKMSAFAGPPVKFVMSAGRRKSRGNAVRARRGHPAEAPLHAVVAHRHRVSIAIRSRRWVAVAANLGAGDEHAYD